MAESNALITEIFRQPLIDCLALVPSFLASLVQFRLITIDQHERVTVAMGHGSRCEATQLLLMIIHQDHRVCVVSQFVLALKQSGDGTNQLLAELIEGNGNIPEYDKEHRVIMKYYHVLNQDIDPRDMIPYLTYINPDDKETIMHKCQNGQSSLARCMLLHLTMRTLQPWFEIFLNALEETSHGNVAGRLRSDFQEEAETAMETKSRLTAAPPGCRDEISLEALSLEDRKEKMYSSPCPRAAGAGTSGAQCAEGWQQDRRSQSMGPPNSTLRERSRSSSKRSKPGTSRQSSRSPKRPKNNWLKRKRSRSRENYQQGATLNQTVIQQNVQHNYYDNSIHNTANITNSQNVKAMVGGERNTMNIGSQSQGPVPGREAEYHQDGRPGGEDQPDRAKMPRCDDVHDVHGTPSHNGSASPHWTKSSIPKTERPLLYEDQLELAEDAVTGKNTVLVAPTGSGKTHVAAYIIHDHFIADRPKPVQERRALFLVTTVNLVGQQQDKLKELLQPTSLFSVVGLHGSAELSLKEELPNKNVIVLTAQLLENALAYIPLGSFSLLVFDECHLCQKGHAYNTIMARYLGEKLEGNPNLPQIVGMTASLGTGKAKYQTDADQHAVQICANMDAYSISMVVRNIAVLELRVNVPKEVEPIEVQCRQEDPFADKINEIMERIEAMLNESPNVAISSLMRNETIPSQRGSQAYRQWCDRMKRTSQIFIKNGEENLYRMLQTCIHHLMEYNSALLINKQVRTVDAFSHLAKMMDIMNDRRSRFDENDKKLWSLFIDEEGTLKDIVEDPANENPLLEKLCQIILEEYNDRPHSRAILFVKTIDTTQALQDWITETPQLGFLNPGRIAGSRDMTSVQQNKVIEQFRNGDHKMLVATNLLEQGTDVPACNLVIRLDYVPSDFGHVQIKGRTRAPDGRSYLITLVDSKGAIRDSANRQREVMMMEAARKLKEKPSDIFQYLMKCRQENNRSERQARQEHKSEIQRNNQGEVFAFCCINCSKVALHSYDVRVFGESQFLTLDPEFSNRVDIKEHPKPKKLGKDLTVIGKMFCKTCGHDWGALTRIQDSYYPSVRLARFRLKNLATGEVNTYKKWLWVPFEVEKVSELPPEARVKVPISVLKKLRKI